jgi:hypothetical protein
MQILTAHSDDIIEWPDGTLCYRHELGEMNHMSDDYTVVPVETERWAALIEGGMV